MDIMPKLKSGALKLGISLGSEHLEKFEAYFQALVAWNKKINLTAITGYEEVQVKHFLDSLTVVLALSSPGELENMAVIDVGTGAGLPGMPLKIVFPGIRLVLLEATARKTLFLDHLVGLLDLRDADVVTGRAEERARDFGYREKFDLVLSRAVTALPALAELTLPFAAVGGLVVAQKKGDISAETSSARKAIGLMGGEIREIKKVGMDELNDSRSLVIIAKSRATPPEYPRRPGIPVKRPIL